LNGEFYYFLAVFLTALWIWDSSLLAYDEWETSSICINSSRCFWRLFDWFKI